MAWVDVHLLLSTLKPTDTQRGGWVNVVGYVGGRTTTSNPDSRARMARPDEVVGVKVQAIMLWSAGDVKLGEYEKTLAERKHVQQGTQHQEAFENHATS